jgi:hypothetical protein
MMERDIVRVSDEIERSAVGLVPNLVLSLSWLDRAGPASSVMDRPPSGILVEMDGGPIVAGPAGYLIEDRAAAVALCEHLRTLIERAWPQGG